MPKSERMLITQFWEPGLPPCAAFWVWRWKNVSTQYRKLEAHLVLLTECRKEGVLPDFVNQTKKCKIKFNSLKICKASFHMRLLKNFKKWERKLLNLSITD